jgi:hypothetical protein
MKALVVIVLIVLAILFFYYPDKNTINKNIDSHEQSLTLVVDKSSKLVEEIRWKKWERIREVSDPELGVVLGDLESHISKDHKYGNENKITWAHQVSHGINAQIRNKVYTKEAFNGFYLLQDRSILLREPPITIREIANEIPECLRGPSYKLYFIDQSDKWNDKPLYLIDEWVAFTNGSEVGKELNYEGWYFELLQAHNFNVYCMYMAMIVNRDVSNYRESNFKKFIKWNIERVFMVSSPSDRSEIEKNKVTKTVNFSNNHFCPHCRVDGTGEKVDLKRCKDYIEIIRTSPEAEKLRVFAKDYFGSDWCKKYYGF